AIRDLRRLAERIVGIDRLPGVRADALDDVAEAVPNIRGRERTRVLICGDPVLAVARQIYGGAILVGFADQPTKRIEGPLVDVGARIRDRYAVVRPIVCIFPRLRRGAD